MDLSSFGGETDMFEEIIVTIINIGSVPIILKRRNDMHVKEAIEEYFRSLNGEQCKICNEWDDKDRFVGPICGDCNDEIDEVIAEAEDWEGN